MEFFFARVSYIFRRLMRKVSNTHATVHLWTEVFSKVCHMQGLTFCSRPTAWGTEFNQPDTNEFLPHQSVSHNCIPKSHEYLSKVSRGFFSHVVQSDFWHARLWLSLTACMCLLQHASLTNYTYQFYFFHATITCTSWSSKVQKWNTRSEGTGGMGRYHDIVTTQCVVHQMNTWVFIVYTCLLL